MNLMKYRSDIDGFRGLSILLVVFYHLDYSYFKNGFIGVDIFIVLSGFLVTNIILQKIYNNDFSYFKFIINRARRLLPTLTLVFVLTSFISYFTFSENIYFQFLKTTISSIIYSANIFLWKNTNYFSESGEFNPLLHIWSLSLEEQFYFIWPIFLIILIKLTKKNFFINFSIFFIIFTLSLLISILFKSSLLATFYLLPFRLFEFLTGSLISLFLLNFKIPNFKFKNLIPIFGLSLIIYSLLPINNYVFFPYYHSLFPCFGVSLLIMFNSKDNILNKIFSNNILVYIGLISYTLYLFHWPIIVYYKYILFDTILFLESIFILLIIFLISSFVYHFYEYPIRRKIYIKKDFNFLSLFIFINLFLFILSFLILYNIIPYKKIDSKQFFINQGDYAGLNTKENYIYNFDSENKLTISIIGDSHARQYIFSIVNLAKNLDMNVKTNIIDSCLSLPNLNVKFPIWADLDYINKCNNHFKNFIKDNYDSEFILISYRWSKLLTILKDTDISIESQIEKSLDNFVKSFSSKTKFIIIGNVPGSNYKWGFKECLLRKIKINICRVKYEKKYGEFYKYNKIFRDFEKKQKKIFYIDPFNSLCSKNDCFNIINNRLIYSDHAHLTPFSSELILNENKNKLIKFFLNE